MGSVVDPLVTDKAVPPSELQYRVIGQRDLGSVFSETGRVSALDIEESLASQGRAFDSFARILDFGCGCGRVLLWLEHLGASCSLFGTDIDADAIEWAQAHIPYADLRCNDAEPPLDYPDEHFDLVYSASVFTHIDERLQDLWLEELRRVTKPGGFLLLSVHGEFAWRRAEATSREQGFDSSERARTLARDGILYVANDAWTGGPFPDWYHTTYHAPWYVLSHWTENLTLKAFLPRRSVEFQDYVLLERPQAGDVVVTPIAPHATNGVEAAELRARIDAIENSRTWRAGRLLARLTGRAPRGQ